MVSVRYAPRDAPQIGRGQWMLPLPMLNNKKLLEKIAKQGTVYQTNVMRDQIEHTDRQISNPQTHWESFKNSVQKLMKEAAKECYHRIASCIKAIEKDLKETNNDPEISMNRNSQMYKAYLASQLKHLKKKEAKNCKNLLSAKLANYGEQLGGMWSVLSKEKRP